MPTEATGKSLWGGRFEQPASSETNAFTRSIHFDRRMWREEIVCSRAHVVALAEARLVTAAERDELLDGLTSLAVEFEEEAFQFSPGDEDIHSAVERALSERFGITGKKLHAGRSRNDLVVTVFRMWMKDQIAQICKLMLRLEDAIYRRAREGTDTIMPGYTHLQRAQPIVLSHHLLAHLFSLTRDFERLVSARRRADVCCLGAGAIAGTTLPIDASIAARELDFARMFDNSMDATASRDFALEFLAAASILGVTLSRIAEDIIVWTTAEFGFAELDDSYATGSSMMPQKKNPDIAELVRGKSARLAGNLMTLLGVLKGLPMAYGRDLQEDKEPVFDAVDTLSAALPALTGCIRTISFNTERMAHAASSTSFLATDLAESLVAKGVAFRDAHAAVGQAVRSALNEGVDLADLGLEGLRKFHPSIDEECVARLNAQASVAARGSHGGTSPERIIQQFGKAESLLDEHERWISAVKT